MTANDDHQDWINRARHVQIEDECSRRGIRLKRSGAERMGACPVCGGRDRFSINIRKQLFNCRYCDKGGDVIAMVQHIDSCNFDHAITVLANKLKQSSNHPQSTQTPAARQKPTPLNNVLQLWNEAVHPAGTPVETYLKRRNVRLLPCATGEAIRFHPACKFGLRQVPCMVALIRNIKTDEPQAIHRTALDLAGNKIEVNGCSRMSLGPIAGGAVKLTDNAEVTGCLGIGEGIESTLSLQSVPEFGPSPIWAVLSAAGIEGFPVLAGIECLWIAVDHDEHGRGQQAARTCSARWVAAGKEAFRITPDQPGDDLNNLTKRHAG
jgi:hypothetical protein